MARLDLGKVTGEDGYSPTVETSKSGKTTTITITDVNGVHTATILDGEDGAAASGDMKKSVYDTNDNGIVDNAEKVNNHTVGCDVPADAVFTDTVFSGNYNDLTNKPTIPDELSDLSDDSTHRLVTDTEKTTWNGKQDALTAGSNITISNGTISATDTTYSDATTSASGLMSSTDKTKLNGIASGAEVNVQANWNETNTDSDSYIQNKPTIPEAVQYSTIPTASADNLGKIVQFTGTTDSTYTNGYFYKCVSDGASTPTYSWENVSVQAGGGGGGTSDYSQLTNKPSINGVTLVGNKTTADLDLEDGKIAVEDLSFIKAEGDTLNLEKTNAGKITKLKFKGKEPVRPKVNLFDFSKITNTTGALSVSRDGETITVVGTSNGNNVSFNYNLYTYGITVGKTYTLIVEGDTTGLYNLGFKNSGTDKFTIVTGNGETSKTLTMTSDILTANNFSFYSTSGTSVNASFTIKLYEEDAEVSTFYTITGDNEIQISSNNVQEQAQTYSLDLDDIELVAITTHTDTIEGSPDNWYIPNKVQKIDSYDGETITTDYISSKGTLQTGAIVYYNSDITLNITDTTLIGQLNTIYNNVRSYQGTTNITSTCETGNEKIQMEVAVLGDLEEVLDDFSTKGYLKEHTVRKTTWHLPTTTATDEAFYEDAQDILDYYNKYTTLLPICCDEYYLNKVELISNYTNYKKWRFTFGLLQGTTYYQKQFDVNTTTTTPYTVYGPTSSYPATKYGETTTYYSTITTTYLTDNFLSKNNTGAYTPTSNYNPATKKYVDDKLSTLTGYDATKTQVLKNVNGTLTWVTEE